VPRRPRWTTEQLSTAVAESRSVTEVLRRLGLRPAGGNHRSIRAWIERLGLSTAHFSRAPGGRTARPLAEVMVRDSPYPRSALKRRLLATGLKQPRCELCGQDEWWRGRRMALILDHVNGVADDHRLENLRMVCPNCAATLDTHCGRNNATSVEPRRCLLCDREFAPRSAGQRYCSRACGQRAPAANRGRPAPERRRAQRPDLETLIAEVRELGFAGTGRRHGVSDNAIRKWIVAAERERARAADDRSSRKGSAPGPDLSPR